MTREERLNNPMGLKHSTDFFQGEVQPSSDAVFKEFKTLKDGVRAGAKTLRTYYEVRGLKTIREIITRWAPAKENPLAAYIKNVAEWMDVSPDMDMELAADWQNMFWLVRAIIRQENGALPDDTTAIYNGVESAYN